MPDSQPRSVAPRAPAGESADLAPLPAARLSANGRARAAAFFDLDKTLMAGSSGLHFGRAARRAGWVRRRDMARFGVEHVRYRIRGSTDNLARGNVIGLDRARVKAIPNAGGVVIEDYVPGLTIPSTNNLIGGVSAGTAAA